MKINTWQDLESFVKTFFNNDKPKTTPGSGNSKQEEDVIGDITISQCKYTDNINSSILEKDMTRLITAANQRNRVPFFFNKSEKYTTVSIEINDNNINNISNLLYIYALNEKLKSLIELLKTTTDPRTYEYIKSDINKIISNTKLSYSDIDKNIVTAKVLLETRFADIMTYDLFR